MADDHGGRPMTMHEVADAEESVVALAPPIFWHCAKHGVVTENIEFKGLDPDPEMPQLPDYPKVDGLYCMTCWAEAIRIQCQRLVQCDVDGNVIHDEL